MEIYTEEFKDLILHDIECLVNKVKTDLPIISKYEFGFDEYNPLRPTIYIILANYEIRDKDHPNLLNFDHRVMKITHECYRLTIDVNIRGVFPSKLDVSVIFH